MVAKRRHSPGPSVRIASNVTATVSRVGVLAPITKCTKQPKWDCIAVHDDMALT